MTDLVVTSIITYMTEITIETGVPLPDQKRTPHGRWGRLAKAIKIGESFLVNKQSQVLAVRTAFARAGKGAVSRKQENGSIRVWCVEKEGGR